MYNLLIFFRGIFLLHSYIYSLSVCISCVWLLTFHCPRDMHLLSPVMRPHLHHLGTNPRHLHQMEVPLPHQEAHHHQPLAKLTEPQVRLLLVMPMHMHNIGESLVSPLNSLSKVF